MLLALSQALEDDDDDDDDDDEDGTDRTHRVEISDEDAMLLVLSQALGDEDSGGGNERATDRIQASEGQKVKFTGLTQTLGQL
jgi:hypothetical protein